MKSKVYLSDFRDAFQSVRPDNFTYEGLEVLFDYLESYEDDTGSELELDIIAICCDYSEATWSQIASGHDIDISELETDEEKEAAVVEYLEDEGQLIGKTSSTIVYRDF
jgi:hypothetical protein